MLRVSVAGVLVLGVSASAWSQESGEAGMQVLTRGPVHEAFAKASMTGATAGIIVSKAPPEAIAEIPPDQRPEGGNVAWIPGYWSWDDDRSDFIWESGVWRDLPPGRQWVPGYWSAVPGGWQWISGFWGDVAQTEVTYLPPPPEPIEAGPNSPAPGPDYLWTPGCWVWQPPGYAWQAGYWVPQRPEWIWVSAHYTWTPRGYVYVPGYWDHDIVHRGMMFAPVYYERPLYGRPDYVYTPSIAIDLGVVAACLFVQPRSNHYYFGDYYDHRYEQRGFYPWYSKELRRYGDDPIYVHYRAEQLRHDPDWDHHVQERFDFRRRHVDARPPQTLALQVNIYNSRKDKTPDDMLVGRSLAETAHSRTMPLQLAPVNAEERKQFESRGREVRQFQTDRAKLEREEPSADKPNEGRGEMRSTSMKLPMSPVAAKPIENMPGAKTPPPMPERPKPQALEGRQPREDTRKLDAIPGRTQPQDTPGRVEGRPVETREKPKWDAPRPNRFGSGPERRPQASETTNVTPRTEPVHMDARPGPREIQRGPDTVESTRTPSRNAEAPKREMRTPQTEPKIQAPGTREATPDKRRDPASVRGRKEKDKKPEER